MKPLTAEEMSDLRIDAGNLHWTPDDIKDVRAALPHLLDEVERARALLKRIQWEGRWTGNCPECMGDVFCEPDEMVCEAVERGELRGHEPGCELAALIAP